MSERYGLDWIDHDYLRLEYLMACIEADNLKAKKDSRKK